MPKRPKPLLPHQLSRLGAALRTVVARWRRAAGVLVLLIACCLPAAAASFTSKAAGAWNAAGQTTWNEAGTPGSGDTVSIGAHAITLAQNEAAASVIFTGAGSISGAFTLSTSAISASTGVTGSIASAVAGSSGLTKTGTGVVALSGACTYSGTTTVSAGTLRIAGASGAIAASARVVVEYGATLDIADTSTASDRLADTGTLAMRGGTLSWTTNATRSESISVMEFSSQHSVVAFNAVTGSPTLTATSGVSRLNYATMEFQRGASPYGFLKFTGQSAGVMRWTSVQQTYYLVGTHDTTNGLVQTAGNVFVGAAAGGSWQTPGTWSTNPNGSYPQAADHAVLAANTNFIGQNGTNNACMTLLWDGTPNGTNQGMVMTINGNIYCRGSVTSSTSNQLNFAGGEGVLIQNQTGRFEHYSAMISNATGFVKSGTGDMWQGTTGSNYSDLDLSWTTPIHIVQGKMRLAYTRADGGPPLGSTSGSTTVHDGGALDLYGVSVAEPLVLNGSGLSGIGALCHTNTAASAPATAAVTCSGTVQLASTSQVTPSTGTTITLSGVVSGSGGLTKTGAGSLALSGANTYAGATTLSAGTTTISSATAFGSTAAGTTLGDATLVMSGVAVGDEALTTSGTAATLSLTGTSSWSGAHALGATTTSLTTTGTHTISGVISGGGALTKAGSGTLVTTRTDTHAGGTTVSAGRLEVRGSRASSAVTINGGTIAGSGTVGSITSAGSASGIAPGRSTRRGTLSCGAVNLSAGTTPTVTIRVAGYGTAGTDYDRLASSGGVTLGGASALTIDCSGLQAGGTASGVITGTSVTNTFATVALTNNPYGFTASLTYNAASVDVTISARKATLWFHGADAAYNASYNAITLTPQRPTTNSNSAATATSVALATPSEHGGNTGNVTGVALRDDVATTGTPGTESSVATFFSIPVGQAFSVATTDPSMSLVLQGTNTNGDDADTAFRVRLYRLTPGTPDTYTLFATLTTLDLGTDVGAVSPYPALTATGAPSANVAFTATDRVAAVLTFVLTTADTSSPGGGGANDATTVSFGVGSASAISASQSPRVTVPYQLGTPNRPSLAGPRDDDFLAPMLETAFTTTGLYNGKWYYTTGDSAGGVVDASSASGWLILRDKEDSTPTTTFAGATYIYQVVDTNADGDGTVTTVVDAATSATAGTSPYYRNGVLLWTSDTDYLSVVIGNNNGTKCVYTIENGNVRNTTTAIAEHDRVWLRWTKASNVYTASYSVDGSTFTNVPTSWGVHTHATTFTRCGLLTCASSGSTNYAGAFDWFDYSLGTGSVYTSATGTAAWGTTTHWTPNGTPGSSSKDQIIIDDADQMTLGADRTVSTVQMSGTGALVGANALTIGTGRLLADGTGAQSITCTTLAFGTALADLTNDSTGLLTIASGITGSGGLRKSGYGPLLLSGANSYTGQTTVARGSLRLTGGSAIPDASAVKLLPNQFVWVEDAAPHGCTLAPAGGTVNDEAWTWVAASPAPFSGSLAHQSPNTAGWHQHYFTSAPGLPVATGDVLVQYVYLDPTTPPTEVMLQFYAGGADYVRAYWGADSIPTGTNGTTTRMSMGALPATGEWVRLEVPASTLGLEGSSITAWAYSLFGGKATWDHSAVTSATGNASLDVNGSTETVGSLAGYGHVALGGGTLTCGGDNTSTTYAGSLTGAGGITKAGTGTLSLDGTNTHTGTTTVSAGTLLVSGSMSSSAVAVAGGTLRGAGTVGAITTSGASSAIKPGTSSAKGILTAGGLNLSGGTSPTLTLRVAGYTTAGTDYDQLNCATLGGTVTLGGSAILAIDVTGLSSTGTATSAITCSGTPTGTFSQVTVTGTNPNGWSAWCTYASGSISVTVGIPPPAATWDGGGGADTNWSTAANWTLDTVPAIADVATFDPTYGSGACVIDAAAATRVKGIWIKSGYSGAITQSAAVPVYCGSSGFVMASSSATYACGDTLSTHGFTQTAGTFSGGTVHLIAPTGSTLTAASTLTNLVIEGLDDGLIGYWKLDEASGTTAFNSASVSYPGTYGYVGGGSGAPATTTTAAPTSFANPRSRTFTAANRHAVTIADDPAFDFTGAHTIAAWVRTTDAANQQYLVHKLDNWPNDGWSLVLNSSEQPYFNLLTAGADASPTSSSAVATNGSWSHVAATWDLARARVFRDGVLVASTAFTSPPTANAASVLFGTDGGVNSFAGELDDVRIYGRALGEAEIKRLADGSCDHRPGSTATVTLGAPLAVSGNFSLLSGTIGHGGSSHGISVGGNWTSRGSLAGTGTVTLTGNGAGKTITSGPLRFSSLTIASGDGTGVWTLQDRLDVEGTLTLATGQLDVGANRPVHARSVNQTGSAGTFVPAAGTVVADGSAAGTLSIATTLNELRIEDPTENDLLAYWKLDGDDGLSDRDSSGNGHTVTYFGAAMRTTTKPTPPLFENTAAATFDGVDDRIDVGSGAGLNIPTNGAFAISCWVKTADAYGCVLSFRHTSEEPVIDIAVGWDGVTDNSGNALLVVRDDANTLRNLVGPDIDDDAWHHVVAMRGTGGTISLVVDAGTPVTIAGTTVQITTSLRAIGCERKWSDSDVFTVDRCHLAGAIDDVRIYGRELTTAEIANLANGRYVAGTGGTATASLGRALSVATLGVDAGTFAANGYAATVANPFALRQGQGTYSAGSGLQTFSGGFTITGGVFTGGSGNVDVVGGFTQALTANAIGGLAQDGGSFTAPSGRLKVTGAFNAVGGAFAHNNGHVLLASTSSQTLTNQTGGGAARAFYDLTVADQTLAAHWPLDDASSASVSDATGALAAGAGSGGAGANNTPQAHTATRAPLQDANARCLDFDGTDDVVTIADDDLLDATAFSISAWIKADPGSNSWRAIVQKGNNGTIRNYWFGLSAGPGSGYGAEGVLIVLGNAAGGWDDVRAVGTTAVDDGAWHHVACAVGGGTARVYVDGVQEGASDAYTAPVETNALPFEIGGSAAASWWYCGKIDDVRFFRSALTDGELSVLAAGGAPAIATATQTLANALDVDRDLTIASGTLDVSGSVYGVAVAGSWLNRGGVFTPRTGTVSFDGATGGTIRSARNRFNDVAVTGAGTWTLANRLDADGVLTLSAGVVDTSSTGYTVRAATVDQTSGAGGFVPNGGTVVVDSSTSRALKVQSTLNHLRVEARDDDGLVAAWTLDDGRGTTARDAIGTNHATLHDGVRWSAAKPGAIARDDAGCAVFDGVDDRISAARPMTNTDNFTLAAWINPAVLPQSDAMVVYVGNDAGGYGFSVDGADGASSSRLYVLYGGIVWIDSSYDFPAAGAWYHVAMRRSAGTLTLWVNGNATPLSYSATGPNAPNAFFEIGHQPGEGGRRFFKGSIDDVRVYDQPLTDDEIRALAAGRFADGATGAPTFTLGANLAVGGTLALDSGILDCSTRTTGVTNLFTLAPGDGKWLGGSATQTFAGGVTMSGSTFVAAAGTVDVNGNFIETGGSFTAPSGQLQVSGTFVRAGGTFTHNSGTVVLDGASQDITGSTTFNHLTKTVASSATLTFPAGATQTVVGTLRLRGGDASSRLTLASSSPGTRWLIDPQSTRDVEHVSVSWSKNLAATVIDPLNSVNGGRTINWFSVGEGTAWSNGNATGIWSDPGNWDNGKPTAATIALFDATSTDNCAVNEDAVALGVDIQAGYTHGTNATITQGNGNAMTVGATGWSQVAGRFTGNATGSALENIAIAGPFALSGGAFTSTRSALIVGGNFTVSGGTFTHNAGTVQMAASGGATLTCAQSFQHLAFSDGLIAHWDLEQSSTPSRDVSGRLHHATWQNAPTSGTTRVAPLIGTNARSMTFAPASSQYLSIVDDADLAPSRMTVSAWIYLPSANGWPAYGPILNRQKAGSIGWSLECDGQTGELIFVVMTGNGLVTEDIAGVAYDRWHHVAGTYDGATLSVWLDGVAETEPQTGTPVNPSGSVISIGRNENSLAAYFVGDLDDVRLYGRALSAAEIEALAGGRAPAASAGTFALGSDLDVLGDLTIHCGTLAMAARTLEIGGSWRNRGGVMGQGTSTVRFDGVASTGNEVRCGGGSFNAVEVSALAVGSDWTCGDAFRCATYTQNEGTFGGGAHGIAISGTATLAGGTFTASSADTEFGAVVTDAGGGVFAHNSGRALLTSTSDRTFRVGEPFHHLDVASGLNAGLVARWRLDEGASTLAYDDVTGTFAATYVNTPTPTSASLPAGLIGDRRGLEFSGADSGSDRDFVLVDSTPTFDDLQESSYTLSAWYRPAVVPTTSWPDNAAAHGIVMKNGHHLGIYYSTGGFFGFEHWLAGDTGVPVASTTLYPALAWYHVAGVVDRPNGSVRLYVNGSAQASATFAAGTAGRDYGTENWRIGLTSKVLGANSGVGAANGIIDDVRFYARALSADEVAVLAAGKDAATGTARFDLGAALDVDGDVTLAAGTLDANGNDITCAGSWDNRGGAFDAAADAVRFDGAVAGKTIRSGGDAFVGFGVNGSGAGAWTLLDGLTSTWISTQGGTLIQGTACAIATATWNNAATVVGASGGTSSEDIRIGGGGLSQGGGSFTSTRSRLIVTGTIGITGGAFVHNSGTVIAASTGASTLACPSPFNHLVISDGLIGHWRFEETATPARDASGWGHHATWANTLTGDAATKAPLQETNARSLGLGFGHLTLPDETALRPDHATIACWLRLPAGTVWGDDCDNRMIFARHALGSPGYGLGFAGPDETMLVRMRSTSGITTWGFGPIRRDAWQHVAMTYDGSILTGWIDGVPVDTYGAATGALVHPSGGSVRIARNPLFGFPTDMNNAWIDDLRVYSRALDAPAMQRLAAARGAATAVGSITLASDIEVDGDLTVGSGTLAMGAHRVEVAGNWRCGGVVTPGTSTVAFDGAAQAGKAIASGGQSFNDVVVEGAGSDWTCADPFRALDDFTQTDGTFSGGSTTVRVDGDVTVSGGTHDATDDLSTWGGAVDVAAGTFEDSDGTVKLTSSAAVGLENDDAFHHLVVQGGGDGGLVAHLRFDEPNGRIAFDASGNGRHGTYANTPTPTASTPTLRHANGYALTLTGGAGADLDYVTLAGTDSVQTGSYSLSAWYKPTTAAGGQQAIIMKAGWNVGLWYMGGSWSMEHYLDSGGFLPGAYAGCFGGGGAYPAGVWYHVAGVIDVPGGTNTLYVDGVVVASGSFTRGAAGSAFYNGGAWEVGRAAGYLATGAVDDVRIYSRPLTADEVRALALGWDGGSTSTAQHALGADLDVDGDLTLLAGGLDLASSDIALAGNWRNYGASLSGGSRTVEFDGAAGGPYSIRSGGRRFPNVAVTGAATWALADPFAADHALAIAAGGFDVTASNHLVRVGTMTQTGGSFVARQGTVVLDQSTAQNLRATSSLHRLRVGGGAEDDLVACWPMDEANGPSIADRSGDSPAKTGAISGATWSTGASSPGPSFANGGALTFDGNDVVTIPDPGTDLDAPTAGNAITIAAWIKPSSLGSWRCIASKSNRMLFYAGGYGGTSALAFWYKPTAGADIGYNSVSGAIAVGAWQHVAVTHVMGTANAIRLYVDGVDRTAPGFVWDDGDGSLGSIADDGGDFRIGLGNASEYFQGGIDDVRVYRRALTPSEIQRLAAGRLTADPADGPTWTLQAALDVDEHLCLDGGKLAGGANGITVGGDWLNDVGVAGFVPGTSLVTFDGSGQRFTGSTNFHGFTKSTAANDTLTFPAGETQAFAVGGTLTLQATGGALLTIASSAPGTQALVAPSGSRACTRLWVYDNWNTVLPIIDPTYSNRGTNHTNWFGAAPRRAPVAVGYPPRF